MADQAFVHGFDTGYGRADEQRQHTQALADQEHQQKLTDLITQRQELAAKIPTLQQGLDGVQPGTPEYYKAKADYDQAHQALQAVNLNIADAYHPAKNPGAIQNFGHLLTDHVGLTNPQDRAAKAVAQLQLKTDAAGKATDQQIAAAPLSPAQQNAQKLKAQLDLIDKSDLDDEGKRRARERAFGVTSSAKQTWQQYKLPDGTIRSFDLNNLDNVPIPEGATEVQKGSTTAAKTAIEEYNALPKETKDKLSFPAWMAQQRRVGAPSTSASNLYAAAYQRAYGIKPEDMTPADWDYIVRKQAYDKAIPQNTTTNTLKQNAEQQWVPVQESNSKSPGGAAPMPPRGKPTSNTPPPSRAEVSAIDSPAANVPAPAGVPPAPIPAAGASAAVSPRDPKALKKEAEARKPKPPESSSSSGSGGRGANSSVKVGDPVMAAPNKEYQDANTTLDSALLRQKQMHTFLKDALSPGGNQQAELGLLFNHIGMTQGAQKGARINQKSVDEAKASAPWIDSFVAKSFHQDQNGEYVFDGVKGGVNLTPEQMKQMVELADEGVNAFKENVERIHDRINRGVKNPSKSPIGESGEKAPDVAKAKGSVSIADAKKLKKYEGKSDDEIRDAIKKAGYIPIG